MKRVVGPVSRVLFDSCPDGIGEQDVISYLESDPNAMHVVFGDLDYPPEDFTGFSVHVENCTVDDVRSWGGTTIGEYTLWTIEYPTPAIMQHSDRLYSALEENYNSSEMDLSNFSSKVDGFQLRHVKNVEFLFYSMGCFRRDEESEITTLIIANNGLINYNLESMAQFFYYLPSLERIVVGSGNNIDTSITELNGVEIIHSEPAGVCPYPMEDVYIPKVHAPVPDGWLTVGSDVPLNVMAPQLVEDMVVPETWYGSPQGLPTWDQPHREWQ